MDAKPCLTVLDFVGQAHRQFGVEVQLAEAEPVSEWNDTATTHHAPEVSSTGRTGAVETSGMLVPRSAHNTTPEPWLPVLRSAIRSEEKLLMDYRDADGQATCRTVWPFAMAFFQTSRVLVAWCELRQDFRHFRADRVDCLRTTGERYPTRRHVLLQHWRDQMQHEAGCL